MDIFCHGFVGLSIGFTNPEGWSHDTAPWSTLLNIVEDKKFCVLPHKGKLNTGPTFVADYLESESEPF